MCLDQDHFMPSMGTEGQINAFIHGNNIQVYMRPQLERDLENASRNT